MITLDKLRFEIARKARDARLDPKAGPPELIELTREERDRLRLERDALSAFTIAMDGPETLLGLPVRIVETPSDVRIKSLAEARR